MRSTPDADPLRHHVIPEGAGVYTIQLSVAYIKPNSMLDGAYRRCADRFPDHSVPEVGHDSGCPKGLAGDTARIESIGFRSGLDHPQDRCPAHPSAREIVLTDPSTEKGASFPSERLPHPNVPPIVVSPEVCCYCTSGTAKTETNNGVAELARATGGSSVPAPRRIKVWAQIRPSWSLVRGDWNREYRVA
jgi:hypothetical protein